MLSSESGGEGSLFEGVVDGGGLGEEFGHDHATAAENVGDEPRLAQADHLRVEIRLQAFGVNQPIGGRTARCAQPTQLAGSHHFAM